MSAPRLAIVIPTLDESANLGGLLDDLRALRGTHEIIVADGGSTDDTPAIAADRGARVITAPRGRGAQLRAGAAESAAPILAFFHADVRLPAASVAALDDLAATGAHGAWAFRLRIDDKRRRFRLVEWGANMRSSRFALPYGDQGLVLPRALYDATGGFDPVPVMEDVILARQLRAHGGVRLLDARIVVSARRWQRDGVLRRSLRNLVLLTRFLGGTSPERLAAAYPPAAPEKP